MKIVLMLLSLMISTSVFADCNKPPACAGFLTSLEISRVDNCYYEDFNWDDYEHYVVKYTANLLWSCNGIPIGACSGYQSTYITFLQPANTGGICY